MTKIVELHTYTAILTFHSQKLDKIVNQGDQIQAPSSLGSEWVAQKLAIKNPIPKQNTP
jgi:hypothetical protein